MQYKCPSLPPWWTAIALAAVAAYFFWFAGDGFRAGLTQDDIMNMHRAAFRSWSELAGDNLFFFRFTPAYRPLPTVLYKASFDLFGPDPFPLRVLCYVFLTANIFLIFYLAKWLTGSGEAALLTTLLHAYHPNFRILYYNTGYWFDLFCFFFYFSAMLFYLANRETWRILRPGRLAVFMALFACALNSKEMAVTLPVMIALYEWLYHPPAGYSLPHVRKWLSRAAVVPAISGAMAGAFIYWRVFHPGSGLSSIGGYRVNYSLSEYLTHLDYYMNDLFYHQIYETRLFNAASAAILLSAMLAAALLRRKPDLKFAWLLFMIGILPVAFIPWRGLESVYVPILGISIYFAVSLVVVRELLVGAAARLPAIPRVIRDLWNASVPARVPLGMLLTMALVVFGLVRYYDRRGTIEEWYPNYREIERVFVQMRQLYPELPKGSRLLFLKDPFTADDPWATVFITHLTYRDSTITVDRLPLMREKPDAAAIAAYDHVFDWTGERIVEVERRELPR